jgi:hypothetical protein
MNSAHPSLEPSVPVHRKVAFVTKHKWPWLRQTENGAGRHLNVDISLAPSASDEWSVVYDDIAAPFLTRIPIARRILFITEPPEYKRYVPNFVKQFGTLVSPYPMPGFENHWLQSHPAINWYYGIVFSPDQGVESRLNIAQLRQMPIPAGKRNRISVVCSTKSKLPRHRERLRLIEHLSQAFPNSFDVYGRGFKPIADKADAIASYRYHLVLENNDHPHFWTEKLADAYLGYSLPAFSGCRNVTDYFPERSMVQLPDITDLEGVAAAIDKLLHDDPWAERLDAIRSARSELIERQNLFSVIAGITEAPAKNLPAPSGEQQILWPSRDCEGIVNIFRRHMRGMTMAQGDV